MFKPTSFKSLTTASAMAAAMLFGAAVHAQTPNAPVPMKNQSDNVAPQPTGATPKTVEQRNATSTNMAQNTTPSGPVPMKNQSDNVAPQPTGATPKSAEMRDEQKSMKQSDRAAKRGARKAKMASTTSGTNATASGIQNPSMPMQKGEGNGK